jgi:hypothetical protein
VCSPFQSAGAPPCKPAIARCHDFEPHKQEAARRRLGGLGGSHGSLPPVAVAIQAGL